MPFRTMIRKVVPALFGVVALSGTAHGQGGFAPQGGEFSVAGVRAGDQVHADLVLGDTGGYLVWQDNHTDGDGAGISALQLNSSASSVFESFQVNSAGAGNQENPSVGVLAGGNHLVVWQGGDDAQQNIFGRVIDSNGVFVNSADILINSHVTSSKLNPAVASLANGNALVTWSSFAQDDTDNPSAVRRGLQGVYARVVSPLGELIGDEFLVNQAVEFSQRTPDAASLGNGDVVVVWVTEKVTGFGDSQEVSGVNILGRLFAGDTMAPLGDEFQINTSTNICANPAIVATDDGGYTVVWGQKNLTDHENSWDIVARHFGGDTSSSAGEQFFVNQNRYGDQYVPKISGSGSEQLVVWTSMGQDGSREGVYARYLSLGQASGDEFRVNTQTASLQSLPVVGSASESSMLVVWSSFVGGAGSVDLKAQRYSISIPRPGAPIVSALSSYDLFVGWPEIAGFEVAEYQLYIDESSEPVVTSDIFHKLGNLFPGTTHTFRLAYKLADGRVSPLSDIAGGTTYGVDGNFDGLPDDWQAEQFGPDPGDWGGPLVDSDGDGVNNLNEFLAGTNAGDADSVLRMGISQTSQGWQLTWNSVPGLIYKVQASDTFDAWSDVSGYRFSAGSIDVTFVDPLAGMEYFRVIRIR